ncbi:ATP-binding protein [Saccharopolyspora hattusasensis]|uniref:ATP-binding protein n=1 Tax=Saccharopolyspora hattusasensis TaxID=1128679 RepID=UPI003D9543CB
MSATTMIDPVSPELKQVLRALKLGKMLHTLPERLTLAKQQHLSHAAFLELVLADEATRRDTQSAQLRARKAGLDPGMRIETWDESAAVRYDRTLWNELTSLRFLDGPTEPACSERSGSARPTWPPRSGTSPSAAATACSCSAPTRCSNDSKPPASTTASRPRCAG